MAEFRCPQCGVKCDGVCPNGHQAPVTTALISVFSDEVVEKAARALIDPDEKRGTTIADTLRKAAWGQEDAAMAVVRTVLAALGEREGFPLAKEEEGKP